MLLCNIREIEHLTDGTGRFKEPLGVVIALGVPMEPYEQQPVYLSSHDESLLASTYAHVQKGQEALQQVAQGVQNTFGNFCWPSPCQTPSVVNQLESLLQQLEAQFNLSPCDLSGGGDFFSEWGRAVYGSPNEGIRVRRDLVMTIWTSPELQARVGAAAMRQGVSPEDYLRMVEADLQFLGGELEVSAAAQRENCRVTMYIVADGPEVRSISPNGPTPSHEMSLLLFQGRFWLLQPAQLDVDMDVEDAHACMAWEVPC